MTFHKKQIPNLISGPAEKKKFKLVNKISLVVFDLDGTLADTHKLIFDSFNFIMRKYKGIEMEPAEIMSYFGPPEEVCIKNIIGPEKFLDALRDYLNYYEMHLGETIVFPGIPELLRDLKSSKMLLSIFTGKGKETTESTLKYHGIRSYFDFVVTGSGVRNHKPHPEGVQLALSKLKVAAAETVMVGDSMSDYKAAEASGVNFIAVTYDAVTRNRLDGVDCSRAGSVEELSKLLSSDGAD